MKNNKFLLIVTALALCLMQQGCSGKSTAETAAVEQSAENIEANDNGIAEEIMAAEAEDDSEEESKTLANYFVSGPQETGGRLMYPKGDFKTFRRIFSEYDSVPAQRISGRIVTVKCDIMEKEYTVDRTVMFYFDIDEVIAATRNNTPLVAKTKTNALLIVEGVTMEKLSDGAVAVWYGGYLFE